ncbi:Omega-hydroxypalmitate O-feruloyl transferase [Morus notabilis]|uniref:Omega-hydroxypalmitate O-feruloyl transferase n=2 Tax=Morus notabilis TaxID=981085 RepID=W9SD43_9ROSA|nr:Omega-hydroxypalmitate O-feruloyl transferase [Morus notabilis]
MGFTTNHVTFDGLSFKLFLQNLAFVAANKPLAVTPCHDRRLLAARSPPRVTFPHPELLKLPPVTDLGQLDPNPTHVFKATDEELVFKIFRLSPDDFSALKERAKSGDGDRVITSFNVVTAFIWRCKALSCDASNDMERQSRILYAVDIRRRVDPPLPQSYTGNAVLTAYATRYYKELEEGPFSKIVETVAEGARRMTNEYARSAIDWGELYKGFPHGEVLVSSWWRLGFAEVEYPWGKPKYSCPVVCHRKDIILFFPDIEDRDDHDEPDDLNGKQEGRERKDGVNVLLALPAKEMEKFETLFHKYLLSG